MADQSLAPNKGFSSWFWALFNWTSYSTIMLRAAEKKILSYLRTTYRGCYVDIGPTVGTADKIWTVYLNTESKNTPLVMLHGLGAGVALWVMNLDSLAQHRPVYAFDLLGFGRSSRPSFSKEAFIVEKQFVKSIEEWRREMNINNMILLGHSMGGYLATSYAISYPDKVKHLILADPWGFPERPADLNSKLPLVLRGIAYILKPFNPLWALRAAGPFGQWVVEKTRPDITKKFSAVVKEGGLIPQYIHQCNSQDPTGESAFHAMMASYGWAKNPMIKRIHEIREDIPISLLYGARSWIESSSGEKIKKYRAESFVNVQIINGAGHHVYADKAELFNKYVNDVCLSSDSNEVRNTENVPSRKSQIGGEATESDQEVDEASHRTSRPQNTLQSN